MFNTGGRIHSDVQTGEVQKAKGQLQEPCCLWENDPSDIPEVAR